MQKIFYSELLKLRHLGTTKFLIIIPFLTVLIAFLMGGLQIFVPFSVYWWEAIFLYLVNGLLFIVDRRLEGQAGHFQNVTNGSFAWKISLMKMVLIGMRTLISSLFLLVFLSLVAFIYAGFIPINIPAILFRMFPESITQSIICRNSSGHSYFINLNLDDNFMEYSFSLSDV